MKKHHIITTAILSYCMAASPVLSAPNTPPQIRSQTTVQNNQFPPKPAKINGKVSCNTRCINNQCWRTYDTGKKIRFQAKQKINPFTNQLEWDPGPC